MAREAKLTPELMRGGLPADERARAKARLDWKLEVAFGLLEVFDRLVSTVGAISSLGQGY